MNRTQDPGSYQQQETQPRNSDCEWQIVGSRKRRAVMAGPQIVGADGEIIERRGPGRPKGSTNKMPNLTRAATMTPSIPSMPKSTTPETSRTTVFRPLSFVLLCFSVCLSQQLSIQPNIEEEQKPPQWKKANWNKVNTKLAAKLIELKRGNSSLDSKEEIDQRVFSITKAIQKVIQETIPTAKPSKFAKPYWTSQCTDVVKETRKAKRIWKTYGTEENWIKY
ncbi:hypothetical protein K3495_g3359 [Podosphaera aphanis]|nr:hypothetical protein K3495_g3359 [Podosphaera aphanis]